MERESFDIFLLVMGIVAIIVFVALFYVKAGYGKFASKSWGPAINNKVGWVVMESPVFIAMTLLWAFSDRALQTAPLVMFLLFQLHYFQRSFIFPLLIKGKSKMPLSIIVMGAFFNMLNALMQGGWLFYIAPADQYPPQWLCSPQFIAGTLLFFTGMAINIHSDSVIRNLRKPGDINHYLPNKGFYKYVTSANYFGEIVEWSGFALLTFSWSGLLFVIWTIANLLPRSRAIYNKYKEEFKEEMQGKKLKRIFPFIY